MTMAITGVPVVASDVQPVAPVGNTAQDASLQAASVEQPLSDFVAQMQGNPLAERADLASPGALASELFGSLRGYLEGARRLETAVQTNGVDTPAGAVATASRTPPGAGESELHGGPARERFEPLGRGMAASTGVDLAQLQRTMDLAVRSMGFWSETTLVVHGTGQVSHSTNTLIKGQ